MDQGTRLGPYEILTLIGEGGMGQVYRARDTRLGRTVAIKVLSAHVEASPERRARFEREARAISALSHPNICALFDVGVEADVDYLVMEHLEGETLASRLSRGALPLDLVLRYGSQIADALELAHRRGIVHRDLKPGNVLVTRSGLKLLDFGLAKLRADDGSSSTASSDTALPPPALTVEGAVFGTPQYMAPEQLEGRAADARADLWAFGCVLYEMVTGSRTFGGTSPASVAAAILGTEPERPSVRAPAIPAALERLILSCLVKDRDRRWQSALDAGLELDGIATSPAGSIAAHTGRGRRLWRWLGALGLAAGALTGVWIGRQGAAPAPRTTVRFEVSPPSGTTFLAESVEVVPLAVSPDGRSLAFVGIDAPDASGAERQPGNVPGTRIWLRRVDELQATPIPGTEEATSIMWSPDGASLAFFGQGKLRRIDLAGGLPVTVCDVPPGIGYAGSWSLAGDILFSSVQGEAIYSVRAEGGTPKAVLQVDRSRHEARMVWPEALPDGRGFLYLLRAPGSGFTLMFADGASPPRVVGPMASRVSFLGPEWLAFARDGALLAQRFDRRTASLAGTPISIATSVRVFVSSAWAGFAASPGGTLVYLSGQTSSRLVSLDRSGKPLATLGPPGDYLNLSISPDGRSLLADRTQPELGTYDIWRIDLERNLDTRVTSGPEAEFGPVWLPGQDGIIYSTIKDTNPNLVRLDFRSGATTRVWPSNAFQQASDVSADGRLLAFIERGSSGQFSAFILPLAGGTPPTALSLGNRAVQDVRFSPDGRYLAFISDESGTAEAYLAPLVRSRDAIRISRHGAAALRWPRGGREILFLDRDGTMTAVPVRTSATLEIGQPEALFTLPGADTWGRFDVTPDGRRFIVVRTDRRSGTAPATAIVGWTPPGNR